MDAIHPSATVALSAGRGRASRQLLFCFILLAYGLQAVAQVPTGAGPTVTAVAGAAAPAAAASAPKSVDPLERGTPRSMMSALVRAARRGDLVAEARYVQLSGRSRANTEAVLRELNELMDRYFLQPLTTINDTPQGDLEDGLPLDRERVGPLRIGDEDHYIELVRVEDPQAGPIWLLSSQSMAQVPGLYDEMEVPWAERMLPASWSTHRIFGAPIAHLVVWAASIFLPLVLLRLTLAVVFRIANPLAPPGQRRALQAWYVGTRWPVVLILTLCIHLLIVPTFGTSLGFRIIYSRAVAALLVVALAWAVQRLLKVLLAQARARLDMAGRTSTGSLLLLGQRLLTLVIFGSALLSILAIAGFEMRTLLAAMGILGVALALGAQKTIENILGGVLLLADKAIAIGDTCSVSGRIGIVEDITLRSVRIRTSEQTMMAIPAGVLAQASLENFTSRGKILAQTTLSLTHGTSAAQLRAIRDGIQALLAAHQMVETQTARVNVAAFNPSGIELELFAYILTSDMGRFVAIREELLLLIAEIVQAEGSAFAGSVSEAQPPSPAPEVERPQVARVSLG